MQQISIKILSLLLVFIPFRFLQSGNDSPGNNDPISEVQKALDGQVIAWNSGDLEKAMAFYRNSPEMLWINKKGIQKGYQPVLENFRKDFSDKSKMGTYSYEPLHIEQVSDSLVYFVIRWKIILNDEKRMGGVSSQFWKKINANWVITAEHAS